MASFYLKTHQRKLSPAVGMTTYEQPIDEMVEATVEMILGRRDRKTVQLRGRLVPRSSA